MPSAPHFLPTLRNLALGLALGCGMAVAAQAATVSVSASQATVTAGSSFDVYFQINGLDNTIALSTFDINVQFDSAFVAYTAFSTLDTGGVNQLDLLEAGAFALLADATDSGSVIDAYAVSGNSAAKLNADQADDFRFLTLTFTASNATPGTAIFIDLADLNLVFSDAGNNPLAVNFGNSSVQIAIENAGPGGVPEPSGLALVIAALGAAGLSMRLRRPLGRHTRAGVLAIAAALGGVAPAQAAPAPGTPIDAVVLEAAGMRLKLRTDDGREFWVTVPERVNAERVGLRLQGQAQPRGDIIAVSSPVFVRGK